LATQAALQQQNATQKVVSKKIKPVKRPGLVLKTPIAYQGNIDPSVIPIQRDGMGMFFVLIFNFAWDSLLIMFGFGFSFIIYYLDNYNASLRFYVCVWACNLTRPWQ
jgi:hypothetical protein